jgi:two-component system, chemotaxis family, response regulator Rcp1
MRIAAGHRQYVIYGETISVGDGSFIASGVICQPNPSGTGLPFEMSFESEKKYASEELAYREGMVAAKKLINSFWEGRVNPTHILLVEDNPGDVLPIQEAFHDANPCAHLHVATDGAEAMGFLRQEGVHIYAPRPDLVLLDLNIPKINGREVVEQMKGNDNLKSIPVAILTSSNNPTDISMCYQLQANCYFIKPGQYSEVQGLVELLNDFWLTRVTLPPRRPDPASSAGRSDRPK